MAGKNLSRKALPSLDCKAGCACLSPGERDLNGEMAPGMIMSRSPPQRRSAARETALPRRSPAGSPPGW